MLTNRLFAEPCRRNTDEPVSMLMPMPCSTRALAVATEPGRCTIRAPTYPGPRARRSWRWCGYGGVCSPVRTPLEPLQQSRILVYVMLENLHMRFPGPVPPLSPPGTTRDAGPGSCGASRLRSFVIVQRLSHAAGDVCPQRSTGQPSTNPQRFSRSGIMPGGLRILARAYH